MDRAALLYSGARSAIRTARDWDRSAHDYLDTAWKQKCRLEAEKSRDRATDYLMRRKWLLDTAEPTPSTTENYHVSAQA